MKRIGILMLGFLFCFAVAAWPQAQPQIIKFDVPGAGTGAGQGTMPIGIIQSGWVRPPGAVSGASDSSTSNVSLPSIDSFTASESSITAGEPVTFTWRVSGATSVQLSGVTSSPASPVTVFPAASRDYTLTASNTSGSVEMSIFIAVTAGKEIASTTIGSTAGRLVPADFTGLGIGRGSFASVFGEPATGTNTVLRQIIRNIAQYGASPITYKITASDQYPASAATYVPMSAQVSAINQLHADIGATFFVGVNLAADVPSIAVAQAQAYASLMSRGSLLGLEIGNEPDNYVLSDKDYRTVPYYFLTDYANFEPDVLSALQMYQPAAKLVGPAWGNPKTVVGGVSGVVNDSGNPITLSDFLTAESSNLAFVSQHGYANQCIGGTKNYTGDFLLTPSAQDCVSTSYLLGGVAPTHAKGLRYRIGETNSMIRGGVSGISNTFQAALWAMDWSAGLAEGGVDGVNWYGDSQKQYYTMFTFNTNVMDGENVYTLDYVTPQYYGVLMFQQATQNSARFLPVNASVSGNQVIYAWIDASNTVRVLILNKDENSAGNVTFTLPTRYGSGTAIRLLEATPNATPAYTSTTGVTLAGQTFDTSTDGVIQGTAYGETITPSGGTYTIAMPITSAALVTLSHNRCRR